MSPQLQPFIVFIHYHLNGGGVTRVIEQQCLALKNLGIAHLVICGENTSQSKIPHTLIKELHYKYVNTHDDEKATEQLFEKIKSEICNLSDSHRVIFHFHNHSIGLHRFFPNLVNQVTSFYPTVLQIHDFAEDGRAHNYKRILEQGNQSILYPKSRNIMYCSINSRDQAILKSAGLHTSILVNCIDALPKLKTPKQKLIYYPIQALRRKNLGEILLIAMATPVNFKFLISHTPPESKPLVDFWNGTAKRYALNIEFANTEINYQEFYKQYSRASHIITTSIQEGFGMAFLEPIYLNKRLFGRDLPEITIDFKAKGITYPYLYRKIKIDLPNIQIQDFGNLTEAQQVDILQAIHENKKLLTAITIQFDSEELSLVDYVNKVLSNSCTTEKDADLSHWSRPSLQVNLQALYRPLIENYEHKKEEINYGDYQAIKQHFQTLPSHPLKGSFPPQLL